VSRTANDDVKKFFTHDDMPRESIAAASSSAILSETFGNSRQEVGGESLQFPVGVKIGLGTRPFVGKHAILFIKNRKSRIVAGALNA
jgi:hypothetical protein